jgi:2-keto-4-pentenoate hydratase
MSITKPSHVQAISAADEDRMRQSAEILLQARRESAPIDNMPIELRPRSLEEAYVLQGVIAEAIGPIGGWKVGAPSPNATPLFSPMPLWGGFAASGDRIGKTMRRLRGIEAEIAFRMGRDLPPRDKPYTREEVTAAIASAHPAIELLESAFVEPAKADRLSMMGDLAANGGFVHGPALDGWAEVDLTRESVMVTVDGAIRFEGTASNSAGTDLLRLVTWLANEGSTHTGGLRAGDWITTGSWSGQTLASEGSTAEGRFSSFGAVTVRFE